MGRRSRSNAKGFLSIIASLASFVPGIGTAVAVGLRFAGVALAASANRDMQKHAQHVQEQERIAAHNASLRDRTVTIRGSDEARSIIYGRTRLNGLLTFACTHGDKRDFITMVLTLAGHPLEAIEDVYIDEKPAGALDANGWVTSGYFGRVRDGQPSYKIGGASGANNDIILLPTDVDGVISVAFQKAGAPPGYDPSEWALRGPPATAITGVRKVDYDFFIDGAGTPYVQLLTADFIAHANSMVVSVIKGGNRTNHVRIKKYTGYEVGDARRDLDLETASGGKWTAAHVGQGIARLHITLRYDETIFAGGIPNFTAIVKGKRVYDPRLDSTNGGTGTHRYNDPSTWAWSENSALCAADYLTHAWGFAFDPATEIDWSSVNRAAGICDQLVPTHSGISLKRYTCNGVVSTEAARAENLDMLLQSMVGTAPITNGKVYLHAGEYLFIAGSLTDDDLADGTIEIRPRTARAELFNCVRGRFRDESNLWQVTDFHPYESPTYITQDGNAKIYRDFDFGLVINHERAQRIAKLILHRARQAMTVTANFSMAAYRLMPNDGVRLKLTRYGWDTILQDSDYGKVFRVIDRVYLYPNTVSLTLVEDAMEIYDWLYTEATNPDPSPQTALPKPGEVDPPIGFTVTTDDSTYLVRPDGSIDAHALCEWAPVEDSGVLIGGWIEVHWKRTEELDYRRLEIRPHETSCRLEGVMPGDAIIVYSFNVNGAYARSSSVFATHTVSHNTPSPRLQRQMRNLIRNAGFSSSIARWKPLDQASELVNARLVREAELPWTFIPDDELQYRAAIDGTPSNVRLICNTPPIDHYQAYVVGELFPVVGGGLYYGYVDAIGYQGKATAGIVLYDSSRRQIDLRPMTAGTYNWRAWIQSQEGKAPNDSTQYERLRFGALGQPIQLVANARYAAFYFGMQEMPVSGYKHNVSWFLRPYFSPLPAHRTLGDWLKFDPQWSDDAPISAASSGDIQADAVNRTATNAIAGSVLVTNSPAVVVDLRIDDDDDGIDVVNAVVTATLTIRCLGGSTGLDARVVGYLACRTGRKSMHNPYQEITQGATRTLHHAPTLANNVESIQTVEFSEGFLLRRTDRAGFAWQHVFWLVLQATGSQSTTTAIDARITVQVIKR